MTIDSVIHTLSAERAKGIAHRFPCRVIMVDGAKEYCTLLRRLGEMDGVEFVPSGALFSGADVMPRYENLLQEQYSDKWLILTGVSEYLRLFMASEAQTQRFSRLWRHNFPSSHTGRIIIPLWGCAAQWSDDTLHLTDDIRREDSYYDCTTPEAEVTMPELTVLSAEFRPYKDRVSDGDAVVLDGLKQWYEYWASPNAASHSVKLITGRFGTVKPARGVTVRMVADILSYIGGVMSGADALTPDVCPPEAQSLLFRAASGGAALDDAILSILNVGRFDAVDVMSRWSTLSLGQKQLVRLWCRRHPDGGYLCHCILSEDDGVKDISGVEDRILHEIVSADDHPAEWLDESQRLIAAMKLPRDTEYLEALDRIDDYGERLKYLTGDTARERAYILHMAGMWLRRDEAAVYGCQRLTEMYPGLMTYLSGDGYDEDLGRYMRLYKSYKLSNTLPEDEQLYLGGIQPLEYENRYPQLHRALDDQSIVLWIDALGAEWLPVVVWALKQLSCGRVTGAAVGKASLPTETQFNEQWTQMDVPHDKLNMLDKLAHKGVIDDPNYYSCLESQLQFVTAGIADRVAALIKDYHRVIITGDHGTSRLAARFFHRRKGVPVQAGWSALAHGRYAIVPEADAHDSELYAAADDAAGNSYLVYKNYDHFTRSGFSAGADDDEPVYGEVHGGAMPEEVLVPIIVFESNTPLKLKAEWRSNEVKIKSRKATAVIKFNMPVHKLEASIGELKADTDHSPDNREWTLIFKGVKDGAYTVAMVANGRLVTPEPLTILPAIINQEGDLFG